MHFVVHKRRQTPAVIIVALIDVLIVLVIFLLVTTTFKQQTALKIALPESSEAKKTGADENPPLVVTIDDKGGLRVGPNNDAVTLEQLESRMRDELAKNPKLALAVNADKNAPWGQIVKVMDAAKAVNIKTVSAFTKETGKS
ncbi:MAG TPA: biopolymer transporter ExbD [Verrucomicrobiae bacterium]